MRSGVISSSNFMFQLCLELSVCFLNILVFLSFRRMELSVCFLNIFVWNCMAQFMLQNSTIFDLVVIIHIIKTTVYVLYSINCSIDLFAFFSVRQWTQCHHFITLRNLFVMISWVYFLISYFGSCLIILSIYLSCDSQRDQCREMNWLVWYPSVGHFDLLDDKPCCGFLYLTRMERLWKLW